MKVLLNDAGDSVLCFFCIAIPIKLLPRPLYGSHAGSASVASDFSSGEFHKMSYEQPWI